MLFLGLLIVGVWLFCLVDVVLTPESECRNLPKLAWVFIVLLFATLGSIAWLIAGRPWGNGGPSWLPAAGTGGAGTGGAGTRGSAIPPVATNPDDDQEFLDGLRRRAEEQRRRARGDSGPEGSA